ncbi:SRPBCC family protein [Halorarius litoreus]|uniref:SRPBCC family protein n=1 Tax=Halorarius litoreus TaxID=2962676 RepID=UPI0020CCA52A|nr:SRPBCC family protein [Halorarius litoreus]
MDAIEASTVLYVPPEDLYAFIQDFSGTSDYSEHLDRVRQYGGPGTDYRITVSWWKFSYTAETRVTDVEPPERIDWRSTSGPDARGTWRIEPVDAPENPPARVDPDDATELRLRIEFDAGSVLGVRLPGPLSVERLIETVTPVVARESEAVVEAMVTDLEGRRRPVDLMVHRAPREL